MCIFDFVCESDMMPELRQQYLNRIRSLEQVKDRINAWSWKT